MKDKPNKINLNTLSDNAYSSLRFSDELFVGTKDYMGIAYFWAYEYRHYLRDASIIQRRRIHNLLLKHLLPVDGESDQHLNIIKKITKKE